jgi:glyoxylase-like metal-dependent hydrolase (beta-lactamase superfamily II)
MFRIVWRAAGALLCGCLTVSARAADSPTFEVDTLADGVYAMVRDDLPGLLVNSNVLVIVNAQDVVVVDTNYTPASAQAVIAAVRKLTANPVRYVVNTHRHADHTSGNSAYLEAFPGVEIVAHPFTRQELLDKGEETARQWAAGFPGLAADLRQSLAEGKTLGGGVLSDSERRSYRSDLAIAEDFVAGAGAIRLAPPTLTVEDRLVLHRGERTIEIRSLGKSHTAGDLVVWLPREGVVATGDMVVAPVPLIGADQSYIGDWASTLDRLIELHPKLVLPGHGPVLRDDAYLRQMRDFLRSVDRQARAAIARGETLDQAGKSVDVASFRETLAGDDPELRFLFAVYGVGPAVGAVYRELGHP